MADQTIIEKIKALRAKVNNAASTEAEVEAAARMVAKLMMQHDVTEDLLTDVKPAYGVHAKTDPFKNDIEAVLQQCWKQIEDVTETKCYRTGLQYNYVGMAHDVEMAMYLFELITMSAKRGWNRHAQQLLEEGRNNVKVARVSYYIGFGTTVRRMLEELHEERQRARSVATGTAVVVRKNDIIKGKLQEMGVSLRRSRRQGAKLTDSNAFYAGQKTASQLNLNRPFGANKSAGYVK